MSETMEGHQLPPMPPKVAAAVAAVMGEVPKLQKGEKNSHGNYNFASIDDFLEAVRPLCAKHGLIIMQDEESFEMIQAGKDRAGNDRNWLLMRFRYTLAHASGEMWGYRPTRTIMVDASMGSQAFGAAQSYSLKQFERALFQIATGEKDADADSHAPADLPKSARRAPPPRPAPKPEAAKPATGKPHEIPLVNDDWREWGAAFVATIRAAKSPGELGEWVTANDSLLQRMEEEAQKMRALVQDRIDEALDEWRAAA